MEKRRAGEKEGRTLTPGERVKNWVSAAVAAWPIMVALLGLLGYTNKDHVHGYIFPTVDDNISVGSGPFEEEVKTRITEISDALKEIRAEIEKNQTKTNKRISKIEESSQFGDGGLKSEIDAIKAEMLKWHGE